MEVHHHSHPAPAEHNRKKRWRHYFWEFLMLFLAVFCGFLAEYKLEHTIEHQRERQYMKTLIHDLENDTTNFSRSIKIFRKNADLFDSLKSSLKNPATTKNIIDFYRSATITHTFSSFNYSDRTIEQLRSAGNFRLIRKTIVSDTLIEYDRYIRHTYLSIEKILEQRAMQLQDMLNQLIDYDGFTYIKGKTNEELTMLSENGRHFNSKMLTNDPVKLAYYYNALGTYRDWCLRMVFHSGLAKNNAVRLIDLVRKEYKLKDKS